MKVKTSELSGKALDWAVAESQGKKRLLTTATEFGINVPKSLVPDYSESWLHCGPLIEKYGVWLSDDEEEGRVTHIASIKPHMNNAIQKGDTQLIAICRAVVASLIGDEIELPEGLANGLD